MQKYVLRNGTLYHHGIKGQKWGQRNYQNPDGSYTAKGQAENNGHGRYSTAKNIKEKVSNKWNGLTDKQKKYIKIGLAVAGTALATYGAYKIYQNSNQLSAYKNLGKKNVEFIRQSGKFDYLSDVQGLELDSNFELTSSNISHCAANVNPSGSNTNCGSVSSAVLLNAMGGDYKALAEVPEHMRIPGGKGYDPKKLIECFDGAKWSDRITSFSNSRKEVSQKLESALLSQGNGAKGIFYTESIVGRPSRPGHYFTYIILDNKVHVLEGQPKGAQVSGIDFHNNFYEDIGKLFDLQDGNKGVFFARLDNCPVLENRLDDLCEKR